MPRAKSARSRRRRAAGAPLIRLSGAARLEIAGLVLLMLAMLTLLSLLPSSKGRLTAAWLDLLKQAFGWGRLVIPFGLGVGGVVLFLAGVGQPVALRWKRLVGLVLLFLSLEGAVHALSYSLSEARAMAAAGGGGGYLGWAIQQGLCSALGEFGGLFVLFFTLGGALILIVDRPLAEIAAAIGRVWDAATAWRRLRRVPVGGGLPPAVPEPASESFLERLVEPVLRPQPQPQPGARPAPEARVARPQPATVQAPARPIGSLQEWRLPALDAILEEGQEEDASDAELLAKARTIEQTLQHFGVNARVVEVNHGPTVTQFGVEPGFIERKDARGKVVGRYKVKVQRIQSLANDLALALAATSIRIEAPVPGRPMLGIEIPNERKTPVTLRSVMEAESFQRLNSKLRIALGIDVLGQAIVGDLATMPHLLIAGATGSGKSVCINAIIACLLCSNLPDELRLIMVDPKRVELTGYNGIPHLLTPVVVDIERVVGTLKWVTREMDRRYQVFAQVGVRNIEGYNASAPGRGDPPFPLLVVIVDELADLMMVAPDEVERSVCRIAQMARATGIHLVIATQRPSVDVVTGLIKANFPARISFAVSTQIDSRVILDAPGAEQLLGRGDMLYMPSDGSKLARLQGCRATEAEIERVVNFWKAQVAAQQAPVAPAASHAPLTQQPLWAEIADVEREEAEGDPLLDQAIALVRSQNRASVSLLQRKLRVGYSRAARIMDTLEERGIVGPSDGANHSREVLPEPEEEEGEDASAGEFEVAEGEE